MRRNAAIVLGNVGDQRAVPGLIAALNDIAPMIRAVAAWASDGSEGDAAFEGIASR